MRCVETFIAKCVESGYISQDKAPWLRYALEKRILSVIITIPLLYVGTKISSFNAAIAFYISIRSIRSYTNGVHAKSFIGCFCVSLISEICFLAVLRHLLTFEIKIILTLISLILIWYLAPYNHPNMALSEEEISLCASKAKKRTIVMVAVTLVLEAISVLDAAEGILLGLMMTAMMLVIAYFQKEVRLNECE